MVKSFKKTAFLLLAIALVAAAIIASGFISKGGSAKAQEITLTTEGIADSYMYGREVVFPESVQLEHDGMTVTAGSGVLCKPDGVTLKTGRPLILDTIGIYTVKYFFDYDGARITASKIFSVVRPYYNLTSDGEGSVTPSNEADDATKLKLKEKTDGLIISLKEGCEIKFNEPVDLRKTAGADGISEILTIDPKFGSNFAADKAPGSLTAEIVKIRLTDCYNPSRYVEILMWYAFSPDQTNPNAEKGNPYYRVSSDTQASVGCFQENSKPAGSNCKEIYVDGVRYLAWKNVQGAGGKYAIRNDAKQHDGCTWKYDLNTNKIYFSAGVHNNVFVNDLSSADIYGSNTFGGFTTGEVFVSISAQQYYQAQVRVDLISLGEYDGAALKTLAAAEYDDGVDPEITVESIDGNTIYAMVGDEMTIPEAQAFDVNLKGGVNVNVFRNYGLSKQINEPVKNGKFTLKIEDRYFIEYSAYDTYGNKGTKVITVLPLMPEEIDGTGKAVVNKSIVFTADKLTGLVAGNRASVSSYSARSRNGQKCTVNTAVLFDGRQIELSDGSFVPQTTGEYTIRYSISDGIFSYETSYKVTCTSNNTVSFYGDIRLPRYFIKDSTYELEIMKAYVFGDLPAATAVKTHVKYGGGAFAEINPKSFNVTGDESVQIKFTADGAADVLLDPVPVIDVHDEDNLKINKYFVGNFTCKEKETAINDKGESVTIPVNEIIYESVVNSGTNGLQFINELMHRNFYIEFRIPETSANYSSLTFCLTDVTNPDKKLEIKIENEDSRVYASIGGGPRSHISDSKFGSSGLFSIRLDASIGRVTLNNKYYFNYNADFGSEFCYLDAELGGIYGDAAVRIDQINTQRFTNVINNDNGRPEIYMPMDNGYKAPGSIVTIYAPIIGDVLSPMRSEWISLSATADGAALRSIDGVVLDGSQDKTRNYQVQLGQNGQIITVSYSARDAANNRTDSANYRISVVENEPPVITFTDGYKETTVVSVRAGLKHRIRFTVTDNVSSSDDITISLQLFSHKTQKLTAMDSDILQLEDEGRYIVYVYAYDKAGNSSARSYQISIVK